MEWNLMESHRHVHIYATLSFLIDQVQHGCGREQYSQSTSHEIYPDSKVHGANIGPTWGRQDPGGSSVGPMNFLSG